MSLTWEQLPIESPNGLLRQLAVTGSAATNLYTYYSPLPDVPFGLNTRIYFNTSNNSLDWPDPSTATLYYVINPTPSSFKVSLTPSGPEVVLTSDFDVWAFEWGPLPTGASGADDSLTIPSGAGFGQLPAGQIIYNACDTGIYAYTDAALAVNGRPTQFAPTNGSTAETPLTAGNNFEVRCFASRVSQFAEVIPTGNIYIGLTRTRGNDVNQWDYCMNISSPARTIRRFPHPANSVLIYEFDADNLLPPRPIYWKHSIWKNDGQQLIRFQGINGQMRYLIDDTLIYTSRWPIAIGETFYFAVMFDCSGQQVTQIELLTGGNALVGSDVAAGTTTGAGCSGPFTVNGATTVIAGLSAIQAAVIVMPPLPQGADDPIPVRFQETAVAWGEFQQQFGTGMAQANTIQKSPVRRFEIEWDGLTPEQAAVLDTHYERSHQGIPFTITNPHTGEVVNNCRYASYTRGDHVRYWIQSRSAVIMRYV